MKILFVTQVFVPDMYANALLCGALCRRFLDQGHDVSVLAGPLADVCDADSELAREVQAAHVHRLEGLHTKSRGLARRAASFLRLHLVVLRHALAHRDYDVVVALTLPPMIYVPALLFRLTGRARVVLWSMDCYPEIAVETGLIRRRGLAHRLMSAVNRVGLPWLDAVIALDDDMARHLVTRGARRVHVIPNWENDKTYAPVTDEERLAFRRDLGVGPGDVLVLYLGNMGVVHDFDAALAAIRQVAPRVPSLRFVFIGDGARRPEVEAFRDRHDIRQIVVRDFIPKSRTRLALGACDLGLITLRPQMAGLVTPSKLYGYLAMGVPVLFVGPVASEVARVVSAAGCGHVVAPSDVAGLVEYFERLPARRAELIEEGARGRQHFRDHLEADLVLPRFDRLLDEVAESRGRSFSTSGRRI